MTEILAPAGSKEAFWAAIANGANAIYLGGKDFSARAFADNFGQEELAQLIETAHLRQVKVYLTVNTLLGNDELPRALAMLAEAYDYGIDAVIIQDLGLLYLIRQVLPHLPVHASTQMSILNSAGANFVATYGAERVILGRELSLSDIAATKANTDVELEVFVHGALCICYSGQCLMSSMIGGRSGNRGRCAQPCRLEYEFVDEAGDVYGRKEGPYLLSPRDLYGYMHLDQLYEMGLAAWKIEGRMKRAEYVATVTRIYRHALDALKNKQLKIDRQEDMRQLLQIFNRDYSCGYWYSNAGADLMSFRRPNNRGVFLGRLLQVDKNKISLKLQQKLQIGDGVEIWVKVGGRHGFVVERMEKNGIQTASAAAGDIVTLDFHGTARVGDRVFKTADLELNQKAQASFASLPDIAVWMTVDARMDKPLRLEVRDEADHEAEIISDYVVAAARTAPSDLEYIRKQVSRLGGSGFVLKDLSANIDEGIILPASVLNQARRLAIDQIRRKRLAQFSRPPLEKNTVYDLQRQLRQEEKSTPAAKLHLTAMVMNDKQAYVALEAGIKQIYFAAETFAPHQKYDWQNLLSKFKAASALLIPCLPRIFHESEINFWLSRLEMWQNAGIEGILATNLNSLGLLKQAAWQGKIYGDSGLNVFNKSATLLLAEAGLSRIVLSPELNLQQLQELGNFPIEKELIVQGALALMISEYCALGALVGGRKSEQCCNSPCRHQGRHYLKDKKGFSFPCRFDQNCRMHVFNSRELCLLPDLQLLRQAGIAFARLDLRLYEEQEAAALIKLYRQALEGDLKKAEAGLQALGQEYTKGHLYRGV
ncbi:MAG: DUF3656 domain-containing U32 family peptidase [Bacillota bacterium]